MFLGHYQLGDLVPITVWTMDSNDTPQKPDDVPVVHIYDADGDPADGRTIPIIDQRNTTGYFHYRFNLDSQYSTGDYTAIANYVISSTHYAAIHQFEVLPGGNAEGNGIAMHFFKQAAADYILMQTDQGTLKRLRNPSLRGV